MPDGLNSKFIVGTKFEIANVVPVLILVCGCARETFPDVCRVQDRRLTEASGIAVDRNNPSQYWTHNDSGSKLALFQFDSDCRVMRRVPVNVAGRSDWEDVATARLDNQDFVLVADIGNNSKWRTELKILAFRLPVQENARPLFTVRFRYPDFTRNAECLLVFEKAKKFQIVPKHQISPVPIFEGDLRETEQPQVLKKVGSVQIGGAVPLLQMITGGSTSPSGHVVVLRNYVSAYVFRPRSGQPWFKTDPIMLPLNGETTGEGIGVSPDGSRVVSIHEGPSPLLTQITLP